MQMFMIAGLLVTLPGIVVIVWFVFSNPSWTLPALVSVGLNILPFVVAVLLIRAQRRSGSRADFADMEH